MGSTLMAYTVTEIINGALEREEVLEDRDEAYAAADAWAEANEIQEGTFGTDWQVYVLEGDVQYATDHHPYRSGSGR